MRLVKLKEFLEFWPLRRVETGFNGTVNEISEAFSTMGLDFRSESLMLDLVSTIADVFLRWSSWISVIKTSSYLTWVLIIYAKTLLIFSWLPSYSFYGGPMGWPIGLNKFLVQFWSKTPVWIVLVSSLELSIKVSGCLFEHQYMRVPLNRWNVDVTERLSDKSMAWYALQYVWRKFDYSLFLLISSSPTLK